MFLNKRDPRQLLFVTILVFIHYGFKLFQSQAIRYIVDAYFVNFIYCSLCRLETAHFALATLEIVRIFVQIIHFLQSTVYVH